jgi:hypothetical protein
MFATGDLMLFAIPMFWHPLTVASGEFLPFLFAANGAIRAGTVVAFGHFVLFMLVELCPF